MTRARESDVLIKGIKLLKSPAVIETKDFCVCGIEEFDVRVCVHRASAKNAFGVKRERKHMHSRD